MSLVKLHTLEVGTAKIGTVTRLKLEPAVVFVNPAFVTNVREAEQTANVGDRPVRGSAVELVGHVGYHTREFFVPETPESVAAQLNKERR